MKRTIGIGRAAGNTIKPGDVITEIWYESKDLECDELLSRACKYGAKILDSKFHFKEWWDVDDYTGTLYINSTGDLYLDLNNCPEFLDWVKSKCCVGTGRCCVRKSDIVFDSIKYGCYTLHNCYPTMISVDSDNHTKLTLTIEAYYVDTNNY